MFNLRGGRPAGTIGNMALLTKKCIREEYEEEDVEIWETFWEVELVEPELELKNAMKNGEFLALKRMAGRESARELEELRR